MLNTAGPSMPRAARGFTLIETLVSLLVISIGLLGVLGMRIASLKTTANANARATASVHAADMLDRLRANPVRATFGEFNLSLLAATPTNPATIAQQDLSQWRGSLSANLANGLGSVQVDPDGQATIVVQWTERDDTLAQGRGYTFTFRSRL